MTERWAPDLAIIQRNSARPTAIVSWHGKTHVGIFALSALATIAAPVVLARAMRRQEVWVSLARPTKLFGFLTIAFFVATGATSGTSVGGLTQRIAATVVTSGVTVLAWHVARIEGRSWSRVALMAGR